MKVVDYAWHDPGRPNPATLKAAGYDGAMRYLSNDPSKNLTLDEREALHASGLGVGVVWETTAQRALAGAAAGDADGREARKQADALGFPAGHPIYAAVDFDPVPSQYPAIADYLRAGHFECYGNAATCAYMVSNGVCSHTWQMDWHREGEQTDYPGRHLHQGGKVVVDGVACDQNDVFSPDCLWFPPQPAAPQPAPSPQPKEETMHIPATITQGAIRPNGTGYIDVGVPTGYAVISVILNGADAIDGGSPDHFPTFAARDIGSGKWRIDFAGVTGACGLHIGVS